MLLPALLAFIQTDLNVAIMYIIESCIGGSRSAGIVTAIAAWNHLVTTWINVDDSSLHSFCLLVVVVTVAVRIDPLQPRLNQAIA